MLYFLGFGIVAPRAPPHHFCTPWATPYPSYMYLYTVLYFSSQLVMFIGLLSSMLSRWFQLKINIWCNNQLSNQGSKLPTNCTQNASEFFPKNLNFVAQLHQDTNVIIHVKTSINTLWMWMCLSNQKKLVTNTACAPRDFKTRRRASQVMLTIPISDICFHFRCSELSCIRCCCFSICV